MSSEENGERHEELGKWFNDVTHSIKIRIFNLYYKAIFSIIDIIAPWSDDNWVFFMTLSKSPVRRKQQPQYMTHPFNAGQQATPIPTS